MSKHETSSSRPFLLSHAIRSWSLQQRIPDPCIPGFVPIQQRISDPCIPGFYLFPLANRLCMRSYRSVGRNAHDYYISIIMHFSSPSRYFPMVAPSRLIWGRRFPSHSGNRIAVSCSCLEAFTTLHLFLPCYSLVCTNVREMQGGLARCAYE